MHILRRVRESLGRHLPGIIATVVVGLVGFSGWAQSAAIHAADGLARSTIGVEKRNRDCGPLLITIQPVDASRFLGETASFSVEVTGKNPTYQWRKDGSDIRGATSSSYKTPVLAKDDDQSSFDVVISDKASSIASRAVTLHVGPFATPYTTQKGVALTLYAWPGTNVAILTKSATLDSKIMRKMINAADGAWKYYGHTVGIQPSLYFNYNGLATIAQTGVGGVDLCGDGCTYIGATGTEIADEAFDWLYNGIQNNVYDQVIFYEFGRSFWLMGSQLQYPAPADSSCEVTGFAVLMRYRSLAAEELVGGYGIPGEDVSSAAQYRTQYKNTLGMIDTYAKNESLNFANTFLADSFNSPYGGCSDLWTSLVIRLANRHGGETFIQELFKEVLKRPDAETTQDAVDNFILAASAAAHHNLTAVFDTQWRWPISTSATNEARDRWGPAVTWDTVR